MKQSILTLLLLALTFLTYGQVESNENQYVAAALKKHYNENHYDSIFGMESARLKTQLTLQKTTKFFTDMKTGAGDILEMTFLRYEKGTAVYKIRFQKFLSLTQIAVNKQKEIEGFVFSEYTEATTQRNTTPMQLPFKGEWTVIWGGDTEDLNYHVVTPQQRGAFDIVITDDKGKSFRNSGKVNEDYYAFGQPLLAPCDAEVLMAVDGINDNVPGVMNPTFPTGNVVLLKTKNKEYIFIAHIKQGTVKVKKGARVKRGQEIGRCGNSGQSSETHLHFHIQDSEDPNSGLGIKCYFDKLKVNGTLKTDYSPIKADKVSL